MNPDFSQIESDVAQIGANERFALFFPEKRPFFLEGVELFSTPIQAVYTRTITSPRWGVRATGSSASHRLHRARRGRPGRRQRHPARAALARSLADQDFGSYVAHRPRCGTTSAARSSSFLGHRTARSRAAATTASSGRISSGGPEQEDTVTGQLLYSWTPDPRPPRPGGRVGRAAARRPRGGPLVAAQHQDASTGLAQYRDFGDEFRADNGFVPQVGYRQGSASPAIRSARRRFLRRLRAVHLRRLHGERDGDLLGRSVCAGYRHGRPAELVPAAPLRRDCDSRPGGRKTSAAQLPLRTIRLSPSRSCRADRSNGFVGEEIDFDNVRTGRRGHVSWIRRRCGRPTTSSCASTGAGAG